MKDIRYKFFSKLLLAANCLLAALPREAHANSYASSLTNNAGEVSFRLNDAADSVKVVAGALTIDLGALPRGLTVTNLTAKGLGAGVFKVVVAKNEAGTPALIGTGVPFSSPRGVTVNQNPASPYFGWVYVANSAAGSKGDGLFAFTGDLFDILNQGATAKTGGLNFATGGSSSPYRAKVGRGDDNVYVTDWSDGSGNLYVCTPLLEAPAGGSYVLQPLQGTAATPVVRDGTQSNNHGSVAAVEVLGTLANGDYKVYTIDEDYQTDPTAVGLSELNSLWRYDVGTGPLPWGNPPDAKISAAPINFASQTMDLSYSPTSGFFYISDRRTAGGEAAVYVVDPDGNRLFDSRQSSRDLGNNVDFLVDVGGIAASYDGKYLATINFSNIVTIIPMINGIPDLSGRVQYTGFSTTTVGRGLAFDRANNLYIVSSGISILQSLSIGYSATNTTSSDGVFTQEAPAIQAARITAKLTDPAANLISESDLATVSSITVSRAGADNTNPIAINFTMGGTATRGTSASAGDYYLRVGGNAVTGNSVTIPGGADTVQVDVVPNDDNVAEAIETINFAVASGAYSIGADSTAAVLIADNEPVAVEISDVLFDRMYEGNPFDVLRFRLQRLGDTNAGPFDVNIHYAGTATAGTDYTAVNTVTMNPGDLTATFDVQVLPDTAIEGTETVIVSVAAGTGYTIGTNNVLTAGATGIIVDDDQPAETVLFSDNFNTDTSGDWTVLFGSVNTDSQDFTASFAFDYSSLSVPPAPHSSGDTLGLLMSVNKLDTLAEAAGVNAYPKGKSFSGNYAVRFDMYLMQNASAGTTEHATFGINHSGTQTNWFNNSTAVPTGWTIDGVWAAVIADGSALGDYLLLSAPYVGGFGPTTLMERQAASLTNVFHQPPWSSGGVGSPGNTPITTTPSWAQVELSQVNGVITLTINNTNIFVYNNSTPFTQGDLMLGYDDSFNSIGTGGGGLVIYDNLRVISLASTAESIHIGTTSIASGGNVKIDFTAVSGAPASAFKLYRAATVNGTYAEDTAATVSSPSAGNYTVTGAAGGSMGFFQIRKAP